MRVPGGKTISEESWQAILNTEVRTSSDEEPQSDPRLRAARGWYESAYEWRIVSYAMHAQAKLDGHDAGPAALVRAGSRPASCAPRKV